MWTTFKGKKVNIRRIGILTGGGDCAGHNAVIAGLLRRVHQANALLPCDEKMELIGLQEGWKSLTRDIDVEANLIGVQLTMDDIEESFKQAGTIIYSSRTNLFSKENIAKNAPQKAIDNLKKMNIDCLVVLGGDDTLGAAGKMGKQFEFPMFGAPKTMDNDVFGTDRTYGFDSAVVESVHFLKNIRTTTRSHKRVFIVELMGRHAGWVSLYAAVAEGADVTLLPEEEISMDKLFAQVRKMMAVKGWGIIVVSEGARLFDKRYSEKLNQRHQELLDAVISQKKYAVLKAMHEMPKKLDSFGNEQLGGIGQYLYSILEHHVPDFEYRLQICGHAIRGGEANVADRLLGLQFGDAIFDYMKVGQFGVYPGLQGTEIVSNELTEVKGGRFIDIEKDRLYPMKDMVNFY